jgi:hypothetical protein
MMAKVTKPKTTTPRFKALAINQGVIDFSDVELTSSPDVQSGMGPRSVTANKKMKRTRNLRVKPETFCLTRETAVGHWQPAI